MTNKQILGKLKEILEKLNEIEKRLDETKKQNPKKELTFALTVVLECIKRLYEKNNRMVSIEEVAVELKIANSTVDSHVKKLLKKGYLNKKSNLKNVGETRKVRFFTYKPKDSE